MFTPRERKPPRDRRWDLNRKSRQTYLSGYPGRKPFAPAEPLVRIIAFGADATDGRILRCGLRTLTQPMVFRNNGFSNGKGATVTMTSGWKFPTVLMIGLALILSSSRSERLLASETHDSCYLCGWADQEDPWKVTPTSEEKVEVAKSDEDEPEKKTDQTFFRIETEEGLEITTCDYDQWLAWQLKNAGWKPEAAEDDAPANDVEGIVDATISVLTSVASAGKDVRFGQWIEPFAMVGPQDGHTVEQIQEFLQWFAEHRPDESIVIDVADLQNRFVGSSPIITTIEEPYSPYDVTVGRTANAANDYVVWNDGLFVSANQPFCIHSCLKVREPGWGPLGLDADRVATDMREVPVDVGVEDTPPTVVVAEIDDPECLKDEWLWKVGSIWQEAESAGERLRPQEIGSKVAQVVVVCDDCLDIAANRLALVWPKEQRPKPIVGAGAKLLARAEVAEQEDSKDAVNDFDETELAQATAILMQWVEVAQEAVDGVTHRWSSVAEVARNRGAQNESQNR